MKFEDAMIVLRAGGGIRRARWNRWDHYGPRCDFWALRDDELRAVGRPILPGQDYESSHSVGPINHYDLFAEDWEAADDCEDRSWTTARKKLEARP